MSKTYGFVFRDAEDSALNIAVVSPDKTEFTEVYGIDEDFNDKYKELGYSTMVLVEFALDAPSVAEFEFMMSFDFDDVGVTSREFIIECYDKGNPTLIADTFANCYILASQEYTILDS